MGSLILVQFELGPPNQNPFNTVANRDDKAYHSNKLNGIATGTNSNL